MGVVEVSPARASRPGVGTGTRSVVTFTLVVTGAVLAFATTLAVSRHVGEEGAGLFFQVMAFFNIALVATTLGADTALVRHVSAALATGRVEDVRALVRIAVVPVCFASGLFASALLLVGPWLDELAPGGHVAQAVRVAAPLIPAGAVMTCLFGALRGFGRVATFTGLQSLLLPTLRFAAVVCVLLVGADLTRLSAAWSWPVAAVLVLTAVLLRVQARRMMRSAAGPGGHGEGGPTAGLARSFWGFASARGVSALVETALEWVDVICVGLFLGPAAAGAYGAVNRCVRMGTMLETTARFVTGPLVSAAVARGDTGSARRVYAGATRVLVSCAWPFFLVLGVFSPVALSLFGAGFTAASGPMSAICLVMMLAVSAGGVQSVLLMAGRSRWQLINKLAALAVAVLGCVVLIPAWGLWGAVTAWGASVLTDVSLATAQVWLRLGFVPPLASALRSGTVALLCFGALGMLARTWLGAGWTALAITLVVGGAAYVATVLRRPDWFGLESVVRRRSRP